ncbi:uncharacterized protein CDAR_622671 [Caerostris darwini]|uniref:Neurensin-1 n=1 Tax=Caerostris darwini TaxID=1538125 RepID=A0AAV4Q2G7_9ARAC|nr:uncharacterized protein CDAR_622671 [Caerostris darwini]
MNRSGTNHIAEEQTNVPVPKDEKVKIFPKAFYKKEKSGHQKLKLEFKETAALLNAEQIKHEFKLSDKSNNNDQVAIPMEGIADDIEKEEAPPKFFGVKNYLHTFYESYNFKNPQMYEDIPDDSEQPPKENKSLKFYWKLSMSITLAVVAIGLILILIGFITPLHTSVAEEKNEEFLVIDKSDTTLNDYLRACRLIGVGMFVAGFASFLIAILVALYWNYVHGGTASDDEESDSLCLSYNPDNNYQQGIDQSIPIPETVVTAQIKNEEDDAVATGSGIVSPTPIKPNPDN